MAQVLNKDPATYEKEKESFIRELQHFHETRGTPSRRPPKISGHEVDLYLLYVLVTSRGGWVKVNSRNEWDKIVEDFSVPKNCVNNTVAIKQIYLRYLDRYEKVHYLGEVGERAGDDDEDSRHRRWSARALHSVPLTYNHAQHNVNESLREYNGLSIDLYRPSEYEKLGISLISPLPNEQDFAINICTILSNEGKHTLKLAKHPKLLHFLLAHAAVFNHPNLRTLFTEHYSKTRGHSISSFWEDVLADPSLLRLADESQFISSMDMFNSIVTPVEIVNIKPNWKVEPEDKDLFCLGRTLGTQDYIGQRVSQIATILRNLSFTPENVPLMGKDITFLRFVLLCCGSKWNNLQQVGWDMLGNIAHEVTVQCPLMDDILTMTTMGLTSEDRAIILASLEVLNKLGQNENNEDVLLRSLDYAVYERVLSFLTLHDIMLLVHTLECLNSLSSLGEKACNSIIRVRGSLDTLVSLITVEAQSYGPRACIQMRVVETVTGGIGLQPGSLTTTPVPPVSQPPPQLTTPAPLPTLTTTPHRVLIQNASVTNSAHATQQVAQENEQFALAWLRSNFEPTTSGRVEQAELYKQYINYCAKIGRRGVIAPLHFPRCVRSVFGGSVGPKQVTSGDTTQQFYEGIQVRVKPLLAQQTTTPTPSNSLQTTPSPILKAQLSAPPKPTPTSTSPQPTKVTQRQQQQKLLLQQQTPSTTSQWASPSTVVTMTNSTVLEKTSTSSSVPITTVLTSKSPVNCRINGVRTTFLDTSSIETKSESSNESENTMTNSTFIVENHLGRPPPLAPLSNKNSKQTNNSNVLCPEETDSTGNSIASSTGIRDGYSATGGEEGDNSMSSLDGFLINGIPNSFDVDDTSSKDSTPKSMMLADLLEKNIDKNDPPVLNGSLRIGEKGLELVQGKETKPVINSNGSDIAITVNGNGDSVESTKEAQLRDGCKRPAENDVEEECEPSKKLHMNGDLRLEDPPEEGNVSSTAANLYAALAADTLEDEPMEDTPTQPPVLVSSPQPRQILVAAGGQLTQRVVVGGQHYVVAQPQTALVQGQTQTVLVAQTPQQQGTGAKTIIILQPQGVSSSGSPQKVIVQRLQSPPPPLHPTSQPSQPLQPSQPSPTPMRPASPPKPPGTPPLPSQSPKPQLTSDHNLAQVKVVKPNSPPTVSTVSQHLPPVAMPSLAAPCATPVSVTTSPTPCNSAPKEVKPQPKVVSEQGHFLCEWRGCMRNFKSGNEVYMHACEAHCPQGSQEIQCLWERCDAMKRKRFSLMTHLYDRHCNADVMRMMAVRRKQLSVSGRSEIPPPTPPTPHPGYAPNAAFHAIKRHALEFVNPKELQDDNEGPVTKSIRLTAALILRNLVIYSTHGRRYLIRYEPHLASVALSNVESSRTIAQLLFDMSQPR